MALISQQRILDHAFKPCPKCFTKVGITIWNEDDYSEGGKTYYKVVCSHCYIQTKPHQTTASAIKDWNTRVGEPPLPTVEECMEYAVELGIWHGMKCAFSETSLKKLIQYAQTGLKQL